MSGVRIDHDRFMMTFSQNETFTDSCGVALFISKWSGQLIWLYDDANCASMEFGIDVEEHAADKSRIESNIDDYVQVRPLTYGQHHEILSEFIESDWTDDMLQKREAVNAYIPKSIGFWLKNVRDESVQAYFGFRDDAIEKRAEALLSKNGIEFEWH